MDRGKAIEMLRDALDEIPHLRELRHGNQEFKLWYYKVCDVLEKRIGKDSTEYERFARAVRVRWGKSDEEQQESYINELDTYETALKSILLKMELARPSRYELTSTLHWAERFWRWKPVATAVGWVKTHRLLSLLITAIMVIAAILTIVGWVLKWV